MSEAELSALLDTHYQRLLRFTYRHVGSWADAEDVLQDALLAAVRSAANYRGDSSLYTWLCGIIVKRAADWHRRAWRRNRAEICGAQALYAERVMRFCHNDDAVVIVCEQPPDAELLGQEETVRLQASLATLPARWRQMLELHYGQELPVPEIAQQLGCSRRTVESALVRARQGLRQAYHRSGPAAGQRAHEWRRQERLQRIRELWPLREWSIDALAEYFDISPSCIIRDLQELGLRTSVINQKRANERRQQALALLAQGMSRSAVARALGISERRVGQYTQGA